MIDQVVQWLVDGGETSAATVLSECTLDPLFADLLFEIGGEREYSLYDVNVAAPRRILDQIEQSLGLEKEQIERAIRGLVQTHNWHIRNITWVPRPPVQVSEIQIEISDCLETVDSEHVQRAWDRVLRRRTSDPEGAVTAARTLVEAVCKHILDEKHIRYPDDVNLPKLYHLTAEQLHLVPEQYTEGLVRRVLGNCQSVVNGIAALRNQLGDAHGKGLGAVVPDTVLAELTVNLAGSMAKYLLGVWVSSGEQGDR